MQTVVIWDSCEADVKFFVVDRDVSRFNHKYVNHVDLSDEESEEISLLVYDEEGQQKIPFLAEFPIEAVKNGAQVIVCGFLP